MNVRKHSNLHPLLLAQRSTILDVVYDIFDNDLGQLSHKFAKLGIFFFQRLDVRFPNVLSEWRRLDLSGGANSAFWESFSHRTEPLYCYWQRVSLREVRKSP